MFFSAVKIDYAFAGSVVFTRLQGNAGNIYRAGTVTVVGSGGRARFLIPYYRKKLADFRKVIKRSNTSLRETAFCLFFFFS